MDGENEIVRIFPDIVDRNNLCRVGISKAINLPTRAALFIVAVRVCRWLLAQEQELPVAPPPRLVLGRARALNEAEEARLAGDRFTEIERMWLFGEIVSCGDVTFHRNA